MSRDRDTWARVDLDVNAGRDTERTVPRQDVPFNIAVLGDFGGRGHVLAGDDFQPRLVDRDNVDELLDSIAPALRIDVGSAHATDDTRADHPDQHITLRFSSLEDFHPDRLLEHVTALHPIWRLRQRLADPRTFAQAARELRADAPASAAPDIRPVHSGGLLEAMLADVPGPALEPAATREDDLQALIRQLVAPHLAPGRDPEQAALVAQVDAMLVDALRALLHHPGFQELEALWRGIDFLTRRLETGSMLRIYLVDVSRAELARDLNGEREPRQSRFFRLVSGGAYGSPWAFLAGCYSFGPDDPDAHLLAHAANVAQSAGVSFVAAADARLAGFPVASTDSAAAASSLPTAWQAFRQTPAAAHAGLLLPRFLMRMPYGDDGEPCELLNFEELTAAALHGDFLWGNPALIAALLLGRAFEQNEWRMRPGMDNDVDRLPMVLRRQHGQTQVLPCAETLMDERTADRLIETGFMPLASMRDSDRVRLVRLQSLATSGAGLAGPWRVSSNP